jgi:hypothetical protein
LPFISELIALFLMNLTKKYVLVNIDFQLKGSKLRGKKDDIIEWKL